MSSAASGEPWCGSLDRACVKSRPAELLYEAIYSLRQVPLWLHLAALANLFKVSWITVYRARDIALVRPKQPVRHEWLPTLSSFHQPAAAGDEVLRPNR